MNENQKTETDDVKNSVIRIKLTERDCPRCDAVLIENENEQCHECINCGYIDCGNDD